jgi:hypothetical protein
MKLSAVFTANSIVALLFGLGFTLVPVTVLTLYGITLSEPGLLVARLYGASLFGYAVLTWSARNTEESGARRAIVLALFLGFAVGFIVSLVGQISGLMNAFGWSAVGIYLVLTLAYGYFQFMKPSAA